MAGTITHKWEGTKLVITSDSGTSSCDLQGVKGDVGVRGPQGVAGIGIQGPQGPTGPQGEAGPQGIQGPQGPKGQDGTVSFDSLSAAQKESIRGPKGATGAKGEKGDPGAYWGQIEIEGYVSGLIFVPYTDLISSNIECPEWLMGKSLSYMFVANETDTYYFLISGGMNGNLYSFLYCNGETVAENPQFTVTYI